MSQKTGLGNIASKFANCRPIFSWSM